MSKLPQYWVIETDNKKELESAVYSMLDSGWRLVGGLSVVAHKAADSSSNLRFYQAMTKGGKSA